LTRNIDGENKRKRITLNIDTCDSHGIVHPHLSADSLMGDIIARNTCASPRFVRTTIPCRVTGSEFLEYQFNSIHTVDHLYIAAPIVVDNI